MLSTVLRVTKVYDDDDDMMNLGPLIYMMNINAIVIIFITGRSLLQTYFLFCCSSFRWLSRLEDSIKKGSSRH